MSGVSTKEGGAIGGGRSARRLVLLGSLYLVQGLPFGFQVGALPYMLRERGVSLTTIGLAGALALPWALKFLWAPLVDRWGSHRFGRRKSWIVPLQALMVVCFGCAAAVDPSEQLRTLLALIFVLNLLAATQDIAVDGWAVDLLTPAELGPGNAAQVIGYKVGMLLAGGILVWATAAIGWSGAFVAMASLVALVLVGVVFVREVPGSQASQEGAQSIASVLRTLRLALMRPGSAWVLGTVATYKVGESMIDAMFKPFLLDAGFTASELGLWLGTWGMGASLLGSAAGGAMAFRWPRLRALQLTAALRLLPEIAQCGLAFAPELLSAEAVIGVGLAENLFGGALTTVMFACMMGWVDRRIGATHFTLLASVEVWGKAPASWLSGVGAEHWGYGGVFLIGVCLSTAFLVWVGPLAALRPGERPRDALG